MGDVPREYYDVAARIYKPLAIEGEGGLNE
eukprot:COSAG01_NODE_67305_length_267_cov_0.928571_1_plen_29_part_10